jgi:hypothetical protein
MSSFSIEVIAGKVARWLTESRIDIPLAAARE